MGISERKEREKQEMRKLIIEAAFEMFVKEGYERTSIRSIADKIEYSPATIYLYYKDKDELLYDVQTAAFDLLEAEFTHIFEVKDPFERLKQLGTRYLKFAVANPHYYDLMFILNAPMNALKEQKLWENGCGAYEFLQSTLQECIDTRCVIFTHKDLASLQVWGMVHGLASIYLKNRFMVMDITPEQAIEAIMVSWLDYIEKMRA